MSNPKTNRQKILERLNGLLESQFNSVIFAYELPPEHISQQASQAEQGVVLIRYAEQQQDKNFNLLNTVIDSVLEKEISEENIPEPERQKTDEEHTETAKEDEPQIIQLPEDKEQMVSFAAGTFLNQNRTRIHYADFAIDKYPVTNEVYALVEPEHQYPAEKANHPVVNITWQEAQAFAEKVGKHLPNSEEWERAARGMYPEEAYLYPWNNRVDASYCNCLESKINDTTPVDRYPQQSGESLCFDMVGNVFEWVAQQGESANSPHYIRSGSYQLPIRENTCAEELQVDSGSKDADIGFRCAKSIEPHKTFTSPEKNKDADPLPSDKAATQPTSNNKQQHTDIPSSTAQQRLEDLQALWNLTNDKLHTLEQEKINTFDAKEKYDLEQKIKTMEIERYKYELQIDGLKAQMKDENTLNKMNETPEPEKTPQFPTWGHKVSLVSAIGFMLLSVVLAIAIKNPTIFQFFIFRIVIASAAAGFGAALPGFLNIQIPILKRGMLEAGGALGLFVLVYMMNPPALILGGH